MPERLKTECYSENCKIRNARRGLDNEPNSADSALFQFSRGVRECKVPRFDGWRSERPQLIRMQLPQFAKANSIPGGLRGFFIFVFFGRFLPLSCLFVHPPEQIV